MNRLLLIGSTILFSLFSFSQTTHSISVTCSGTATTLTIQSGDALQFINDGCSGDQQFQVDVDGNSVVGSPFYTLVSDTIYETTPTSDMTIGVYALADMSLWKVIEVTVINSVGDEEVTDFNLSIYPNPVTDYLTISGKNIESVKVFNMIGRLVISDTDSTSDNKLDVSNLKKGIYMGFINDQKQFKFIKK
jgi:hypothetical protein